MIDYPITKCVNHIQEVPRDCNSTLTFEIQVDAEFLVQNDEIVIPKESVKAILTDIEGTTTSISFVKDVLFPYAKQNVHGYLLAHQQEPAISQIIQEVKEIAGIPQATVDDVAAILLTWMDQDKKITPLKTLQGMMWEDGYQQGAFQGHLYADAYQQLMNWNERGIPLYVYSSGSVHAQKLLFSHSVYGDITLLFTNYYDTKIGSKKESASYSSISQQIGLLPESILFLSDSIDELNAAYTAGMQPLLLSRDSLPPADCVYPAITTFNQISIQ